MLYYFRQWLIWWVFVKIQYFFTFLQLQILLIMVPFVTESIYGFHLIIDNNVTCKLGRFVVGDLNSVKNIRMLYYTGVGQRSEFCPFTQIHIWT